MKNVTEEERRARHTGRPWMLKNVTDEERNAAIMAADKAEEPIGRWCGRKLFEAAQAELAPSRKQVIRTEESLAVQANTSAARQLIELAEAADRLARVPADSPALRGIRSAGLRRVRDELRTLCV